MLKRERRSLKKVRNQLKSWLTSKNMQQLVTRRVHLTRLNMKVVRVKQRVQSVGTCTALSVRKLLPQLFTCKKEGMEHIGKCLLAKLLILELI